MCAKRFNNMTSVLATEVDKNKQRHKCIDKMPKESISKKCAVRCPAKVHRITRHLTDSKHSMSRTMATFYSHASAYGFQDKRNR